MIYEQCEAMAATHRPIQCVMFKGHMALNSEMKHNFGGLGPYTPGMNPQDYIETNHTHLPRWRRFFIWIKK